MLSRYQVRPNKSWTFVENADILWKTEAGVAHALRSFSSPLDNHSRFGVTEFEPLLDSEQAARLLQVHRKTLQKMARRGEIHGSHVGKLWRFRASDLNEWLDQQERAS
jgi:excisionase family DNA binding protein